MNEEVINWIIAKTESRQIHWKRYEKGPTADLRRNEVGLTFKATCINGTDKLFKELYVGLRGSNEILCLIIVDNNRQWHYKDAKNGKISQRIKDTFSCFFIQRCLIKKKHSVYKM